MKTKKEKQQVFLDIIGECACIKRSNKGPGIVLDKSQGDILNDS